MPEKPTLEREYHSLEILKVLTAFYLSGSGEGLKQNSYRVIKKTMLLCFIELALN